jgi:hypothetical protein
MKLRIRQSALSIAVFCCVLAGLICFDDRVRDRFSDVIYGSNPWAPMNIRIGELGSALVSALRYQSIENSPVLVFTVVGCILFVFMAKM